MTGFVEICDLALVAAVLLATGGAHLAGLGGFARLLRRHGLVPAVFAAPLAAGLGLGELAVGAAALAALAGGDPRLATAAFTAALGAGVAFLVYLRRLLVAGHTGSCGCSPLASPLTPASFVPASALVAAGVLGLLARWAANPAPPFSDAWSGLAVAWGLTLAALVLLLPASAPGRAVETAS